ncbi:MAG: DUF1489 family protein [Sphingomonadaceae bacterium]|nr:DUF1489 family protein [Sphingomonadaceae bacterium]
MLHLSKVAVGCADLAALTARHAERAAREGFAYADTRFMPVRAADLAGGSLFWIVRHTLIARQAITGLAMVETERGTKCRIALATVPVPVVATPRRAHQGWRYLRAEDAPADLADDATGGAMPAAMVRALAAMGLI